MQDLVDHYPEASAKAVNALNRYVEKLQKDGKELNPYLVERAFTTIITVLKTLEVDPQLQHTNHMAFLSDVYYLLVALDIDVN
ncbi:MAG: hypothetical protein H6767_09595 [Candidatus Peribacteria bacterium]|nr:MAG: hypothetical protein H6767_09595 [Candidatus Peribacteria bacterium]